MAEAEPFLEPPLERHGQRGGACTSREAPARRGSRRLRRAPPKGRRSRPPWRRAPAPPHRVERGAGRAPARDERGGAGLPPERLVDGAEAVDCVVAEGSRDRRVEAHGELHEHRVGVGNIQEVRDGGPNLRRPMPLARARPQTASSSPPTSHRERLLPTSARPRVPHGASIGRRSSGSGRLRALCRSRRASGPPSQLRNARFP
jgi:hypothetical protein